MGSMLRIYRSFGIVYDTYHRRQSRFIVTKFRIVTALNIKISSLTLSSFEFLNSSLKLTRQELHFKKNCLGNAFKITYEVKK